MEAKNTWKHGFWVRGIKSLWKKGPWPNTLVPLPCDFDSSFFHLSTNELRHSQVFWRPDFSERLTDPQGTMSLYGCHGRGMGVDTLLYLRWITSEDPQHSMDSAGLSGSRMGGVLGESGYMYTCGWGPSCSPETITMLLIGDTQIQNKKFQKKKCSVPDVRLFN